MTSSDRSPVTVTPHLLREWGMPTGGASKHDRGSVLVVGGAASSPGAAMLAGLAALRVGGGRLTLAVDADVATAVAVAVPEAGAIPLPRGSADPLGAAGATAAQADAVVFGPGLDDLDHAGLLLAALGVAVDRAATVVVDAFGLGALARDPGLRDPLPERLVLTPNPTEAAILLDRDDGDLDAADLDPGLVRELAVRYRAVVSCQGTIAAPDGRAWALGTGSAGLGTSGSGDVLAGAVGGVAARGVPSDRAAVWGTHLHAAAGDRLSARVGPTGYLARELLDELPRALVEVHAGTPSA